MYTTADRRRMQVASLTQAIADKRRRLENVRKYIEWTAPGAPEESANSHKLWKKDEIELLADIAGLESELKQV